MPNLTPFFNWDKPVPGSDGGSWGGKLNTLIDAISTQCNTLLTAITARLPLSGGVMTGRLDLLTSTAAVITRNATSGALPLDLVAGHVYVITPTAMTTLSFVNPPTGAKATAVLLRIVNGFGKITWPTMRWGAAGGAAPPTLSTLGLSDLVLAYSDDGGATWFGIVVELGLT